jgi:Rrf2 family iron-sulfur cluster assembly transcriptional regulator
MKLGTKGRYGVMAMADLAGHSLGDPVTLAAIAERQNISQAYLEQIFVKLRRAGLVESVRGAAGGYRLGRPADEITIADIVAAVEETMEVTRCEAGGLEGCVNGQRCLTHDLWDELERHINMFLEAVSLGDVVHRRVRGRASAPAVDAALDRMLKV